MRSYGESFSGTYEPEYTNDENCSSFVVLADPTYMKVGDVVSVSGYVTVIPISASTRTRFNISLPLPSNFSSSSNAAGVMRGAVSSLDDSNNVVGYISADTITDDVRVEFITGAVTSNVAIRWQFQYQVL